MGPLNQRKRVVAPFVSPSHAEQRCHWRASAALPLPLPSRSHVSLAPRQSPSRAAAQVRRQSD